MEKGIISDYDDIGKMLEKMQKISAGFHQFECEKCNSPMNPDYCAFCEGGFFYQFGAEKVQKKDGHCQLCKNPMMIIEFSGEIAALDEDWEDGNPTLYTDESEIGKEIVKKQKRLLSLCPECREKEGGVQEFSITNIERV